MTENICYINRDASATQQGFAFQDNAAIVLMLDYIRDLKNIKIEGQTEDIEITLNNGDKIYGQAKCFQYPDQTKTAITKLKDALKTLNEAAKNNDGIAFVYLTNNANPLNLKNNVYFNNFTHLTFGDLSQTVKDKIQKLFINSNIDSLNINNLEIYSIPFHGEDPKNRYKEIRNRVNYFVEELQDIEKYKLNITRLLNYWQYIVHENSTTPGSKPLTKENILWPAIVIIIEDSIAEHFVKDFPDEEIKIIKQEYSSLINAQANEYEFITSVLFDYDTFKNENNNKNMIDFVNFIWEAYEEKFKEAIKEPIKRSTVTKYILHKIVSGEFYVKALKQNMRL